jgi:hypothetical protein
MVSGLRIEKQMAIHRNKAEFNYGQLQTNETSIFNEGDNI